jgi:hypothetical protein
MRLQQWEHLLQYTEKIHPALPVQNEKEKNNEKCTYECLGKL